jgi:hypothetical protein
MPSKPICILKTFQNLAHFFIYNLTVAVNKKEENQSTANCSQDPGIEVSNKQRGSLP